MNLPPDQAPPIHGTPASFAHTAPLPERRVANARLVSLALPILENLLEQIGSDTSLVLLADRDGDVLRLLGDPLFLAQAADMGLAPGAGRYECAADGEAGGIAAFERQLVAAPDDRPPAARQRYLICLATPIQAPTGGFLGILDLTGAPRAHQPMAEALLTTTAEMIEHRLLEHLEGAHLTLRFSPHPELLGGPLEGLAQFDQGGRLLAANRPACKLLGSAAAPGASFESLVACAWQQAENLGHIPAPPARPLRLTSGQAVIARLEPAMGGKMLAQPVGRACGEVR